MIPVELSWSEVWFAINAGVMRRLNAVRNGRKELYQVHAAASWNEDINGCIAELALAKYLGVFWSGTVGRIDLPDVGRLEVRSKIETQHRLVVRKSDDDAKLCVSVLVGIPTCQLCGWMLAQDAKRSEWLLADPGKPDRFFVPNAELHPVETLRAHLTESEEMA
ncbi:hypothetical protein ACVWZM_000763 [Bradyrhizobium sp. USDA 4501]